MPGRRPHAEAGREAVEELRRERDLGHQDQRLPALPHRLGDRLEIDLGLAGARHALEQRHGGAARADDRGERRRGVALPVRERRAGMVRVGRLGDRLGGERDGLERALVDEPVDRRRR